MISIPSVYSKIYRAKATLSPYGQPINFQAARWSVKSCRFQSFFSLLHWFWIVCGFSEGKINSKKFLAKIDRRAIELLWAMHMRIRSIYGLIGSIFMLNNVLLMNEANVCTFFVVFICSMYAQHIRTHSNFSIFIFKKQKKHAKNWIVSQNEVV